VNVLVFANGVPPSKELVQPHLDDSPLLVAADGGANGLLKLNVAPHFVVGDLDSLSPAVRKRCPGMKVIKRTDQNKTDLEKALDFCLEQGATEILVFGATGRRLDHELANLGILQRFSRRVSLAFLDEQFLIRVVRGEFRFKTRPGQMLSLLALQPARGVSLRGVQFPLKSAPLDFGGRGVSNLALGPEVVIQIDEGELFLFLAHHVR